ncbi:hypothetical protein Poly51_45110 [Rubripirellula tenax]|uniref:Uncharacterized protein n=1 Tax=Rubripirellula tenax TaxID=2528015 RepID=A0A5C6EJE7_9BACT|nr:hypothetical protein [Rubripirellula tenax]TWU48610.1 hypothetical protein Poly51_45110 [Rubripirellula tenax]
MKANPYQPPTNIESSPVDNPNTNPNVLTSLSDLVGDDTIDIAGTADYSDLGHFLKIDGDLGYTFPAVMIGCLALFMLVTIGFGGREWIPIGVFASLLLVTVLAVSTRGYRRSLFLNSHPDWNTPLTAQFHKDGLTILEEHVRTRYRWASILDFLSGTNLLVVRVATPAQRVILINPSMMTHLDGWNRMVALAKRWQAMHLKPGSPDPWIKARASLRNRERPREVTPPPDSIPFAGPLTNHDMRRGGSNVSLNRRPWRTHLVRCSILVSVAAIFFELVRFVFPASGVAEVILFGYAVAGAIWFISLRHKQQKEPQLLHFFAGYVSDEGIVTDFGNFHESFQWPAIVIFDQSDQHVTLRRSGTNKFIHLKSDMFTDHGEWQATIEKVVKACQRASVIRR